MLEMEFKGIDKLDKLKSAAENLTNTSVSFSDLFTEKFMHTYSNFNSIQELFQFGGFKIHSIDDLKSAKENKLDTFISEHTQFAKWDEMLQCALKEYTLKHLNL